MPWPVGAYCILWRLGLGMRLTPQEIWSFAQRTHASLLRSEISPAKTLLRRVARRNAHQRHHVRYMGLQNIPAHQHGVLHPPVSTLNTVEAESRITPRLKNQSNPPRSLPTSCPGCGALTQETQPGEAGFYTRSRKAVKSFLHHVKPKTVEEGHNDDKPHITPQVMSTVTSEIEHDDLHASTQKVDSLVVSSVYSHAPTTPLPVCDRCHELIYYARGVSIAHPSIDSLADSISESPFRQNHVYHVLDAADFPLSLIPSVYNRLSLAKPRTQNRRSQHKFSSRPTISFIITRSDLLGPTKEMVDSLMPYFTSVLRTALGRFAEDIRLGNVHLVSSKRGWWTRDIKESIWKRGGGNWMIGKVNVGKSNLFEVLFPKGGDDRVPSHAELEQEMVERMSSGNGRTTSLATDSDPGLLSETSLLPPAQPESQYPALPLVSFLPGTTASPIRLPFGNHKGELIDLPGLARGNIETYVQPEHKVDLVMTHRPNVKQHNIRPGQSLLLGGGLARVTPMFEDVERDTTFLAYPFIPISAHVTATEKAIGTQLQQRESGLKSILADAVGEKMALAGTFKLETDVTKSRAGSVLRAGVKVEKLPFRVFATDILIEGVGWVELVCQVRKRRQSIAENSVPPAPEGGDALSHLEEQFPTPMIKHIGRKSDTPDDDFPRPVVEIFTPEGKHVGQRRCMGAWDLWSRGRNTKRARRTIAAARPRKSMKGAKKREKMLKRQAKAVAQPAA